MKHKHYDCIVAWAEGAEIEFLSKFTGNFERATTPDWDEDTQYRIKPQQKEPRYLYVYEDKNGFPVLGTNKYSGCVGKIKLENEE